MLRSSIIFARAEVAILVAQDEFQEKTSAFIRIFHARNCSFVNTDVCFKFPSTILLSRPPNTRCDFVYIRQGNKTLHYYYYYYYQCRKSARECPTTRSNYGNNRTRRHRRRDDMQAPDRLRIV